MAGWFIPAVAVAVAVAVTLIVIVFAVGADSALLALNRSLHHRG